MKHVEMSQQVNQLAKRTSRIKKTGLTLIIASIIFGLIGGVALLLAHTFQPDYREFVLYVPKMLIPAGQGDGFAVVSNPMRSMLGALRTAGIVSVVIMLFFAGYRAFVQGESIASLGILVVFGMVCIPVYTVMLPLSDDEPVSDLERIQQYVKEDRAQPLLEYVQENVHTPEMRLSWEYACLSAQVAIKTGKPAAELAKQAVEGYARDEKTLKMVPSDISYAMEMTAFNRAVSAPALRYQAGSLKKVNFFSGVARSGFYCAAILLILGLILFSSGLRLKRRVSYLQTYY